MSISPHLHYRRHEPDEGRVPRTLPTGWWIVFGDAGALVVDGSADWPLRLPRTADFDHSLRLQGPIHELGVFYEPGVNETGADRTGVPIYAAQAADHDDMGPALTISGEPFQEVDYRKLFTQISNSDLALVGRAMQLIQWDGNTRFCSRCGSPTVAAPEEAVKNCSECGHTQYPRLAPAMIVGVVRDGTLLLAAAPRFKKAFYSILAGFVEPGETAEECVHREVYEETQIRVKDVRYFGSQAWPFPHSFMLGFTAEYESGEIKIDGEELIDAGWYSPDNMPAVPSELSISGKIIRWFRETHG